MVTLVLAHRLRRLVDQAFCVANPSRREVHAVKSSCPVAAPIRNAECAGLALTVCWNGTAMRNCSSALGCLTTVTGLTPDRVMSG